MFGVTLSSRAKTVRFPFSVQCNAQSQRGSSSAAGPRTSGLWKPAAKKLVVPERNNAKALNKSEAITGITLEAFDGVTQASGELATIEKTIPSESFARKMYADECESAVNKQINIEYSISYLYHSMYAFFDRDNVGLPGFANYFKEESLEERSHAEKLIDYQNLRGGRVLLGNLMSPITEFDEADKGEALYAMELSLSLEKLNYEKLLDLHSTAEKNGDPALTDFIEGEMLEEQVDAINKVAKMVSQLRRIGKGHAVWHFDQSLAN
jgi:ferritin heavy chain